MTTDDKTLTEQIAYAVHDMRVVDKHPGDDNHPFNIAAAVLPIMEAEVRAAKAEAILMDGFDVAVADLLADAGYAEYAEDEDGGVTWVSAPLGEVLHIVRICATEYETGDPMTTDPFTPHADSIQTAWVLMCQQQSRIAAQPPVKELEAEFDRFLARVRRDAARAALDGLADDQEQFAREIPAFGGQAHRLAGAARSYRDRHYPEETP
ncbi:hypothetical protein [Brachybacterium alimentarium]|uniref:hypothetical protein n=1 Tax=Brachybacterium alimentarium TaxID=47845 RepID=UPI000DF28B1F|nr:hypothetical protein [Brachybacterium alimentarium]RCS81838.1 hypothetical protein CIK67_15690 [Brachybacterium alimentarium]